MSDLFEEIDLAIADAELSNSRYAAVPVHTLKRLGQNKEIFLKALMKIAKYSDPKVYGMSRVAMINVYRTVYGGGFVEAKNVIESAAVEHGVVFKREDPMAFS